MIPSEYYRRILLTLFTFAILIAGSGEFTSVKAQEISTGISPGFAQIVIKPGQTSYIPFEMRNLGDPQVFRFQLYTLGNPDLQGNMEITRYTGKPFSMTVMRGTEPVLNPFLLRSKTAEKVSLRIIVPKDTPEGDYAFALTSQTEAQPAREGTVTSKLSAGAGAMILVTVTNDGIIEEETITSSVFTVHTPLKLSLFGAHFELIGSGKEIPMSITFANTGNYSVTPQGSITIKKSFGPEEKFAIPPQFVFAQSQRVLSSNWDRITCLEKYSRELCQKDYTLILPGYTFGMYEATAQIQTGESGTISYQKNYFVVMPYSILIILMILLSVIAFLLIVEWRKHHPGPIAVKKSVSK
jgi:hypothetical protein